MAETGRSGKASTAKTGRATGGSELEKISAAYGSYAEGLNSIQQETAKKYMAVASNFSDTLLSLQQDALSADSSTEIAMDLVRAYNRQDSSAILNAYQSLGKHLQQRYESVSKRYQDAVNACSKDLTELSKKAGSDYEKCNSDYTKAVNAALRKIDFDKMDRTSKAVMAHSLLIDAMLAGEHTDAT